MKFLKKAGFALAFGTVWMGLNILSLVMIALHPRAAWADLRSVRKA